MSSVFRISTDNALDYASGLDRESYDGNEERIMVLADEVRRLQAKLERVGELSATWRAARHQDEWGPLNEHHIGRETGKEECAGDLEDALKD